MDAVEPSLFRLSYKTENPKLRQLADCYWATHRANGRVKFKYDVVKDLAPRFGLRKTAAGVTGPAMLAAAAFYRCPRCGEEVQYSHRTAFSQDFGSFNNGRSCLRCQTKQNRAEAAVRRKAIRRVYRVPRLNFDLRRFTLKDTIFSLALIHASHSRGSSRIASSVSFQPRLAPCKRFDREILLYLSTRRIIAVDPNSEEESFAFDDDGKPSEYWPAKVRWRLCDVNPKSFVTRLEELVARKTFPIEWVEDVEPLSREIALYECIECYEMVMRANYLTWASPPDCEQAFSRLLDSLPVSQIQTLICHVMKQTYDVARQRQIDVQECGTLYVEKLNEIAELVRNGKASIEAQSRFAQCPRSAVSFIFFESLLHVGDDGFTKPISSFRLPQEQFASSPTSALKVTIISAAVELSKQGQQRPLLSYLAGLSATDRAQVAAVMLIGRGDEDPSNFEDIVRRWTRPLDGLQPEYLAGKRRLWKFLEKGLEELTRAACC